jgi:DNA replication protein DnaC
LGVSRRPKSPKNFFTGRQSSGVAIAACRQRCRVRFITAAGLANQLVEAQREHSPSRVLARWSRVELIVIDELGYVPLAEVAAELPFRSSQREPSER